MATTDCDTYVNAYLTKHYAYMSDDDKAYILAKAKMFYFRIKFPCEPEATETEHTIAGYDIQWICSACDEIIERLGISSALAYQENGISLSFGRAQISEALMNMLKPYAGIPS